MELLAYIQEEFVRDDQAIATEEDISPNINIESTFQAWLKKLTTKSTKLSLNVILASTTILIGLGSTFTALAEVTPSSDVKYVQSLLAKNGFDPGAIDGVAGASTKNAILRAQKHLGLATDGIMGSRTIAALEGVSSKIDKNEIPRTIALTPSSSVMNLQKLLSDRGFYNGEVDGLMGNQTREAIVAAQKAYKLIPDGVAGSQTLAALESDRNTSVVTPISTTTTTATTKSTEVANLQDLLSKRGFYNGAIDGLMGKQTSSAIRAAQQNYGLTVDGIAGSQTIAALESGSSKVNVAIQNRDVAPKDITESKVNNSANNNNTAKLQQLLTKRGFYKGTIDGVKGEQTREAIMSAQQAYGLTPDGIAGTQTIAALEKNTKTSAAAKPTTNQTDTQAAKTNSSEISNDVVNLQNLLTDRGFYTGPITGFFGPLTKTALISAQKAYGLKPDGVASTQTVAALELGSPKQQISTPNVRVEPTPQPQSKVTPIPQPQQTVQPQATPIPQPQQTVQPQVTPTPQPQQTAQPQATPTPQASAGSPQISQLQTLLSKKGFYYGKVDGVLTGETRNAIVRAQSFYTVSPADGLPSNKLIDSLSKDVFISEGN